MARAQARNGAHVPSVESVFFLIDTAVATEQAFPTCHLAQLPLLVTTELLIVVDDITCRSRAGQARGGSFKEKKR